MTSVSSTNQRGDVRGHVMRRSVLIITRSGESLARAEVWCVAESDLFHLAGISRGRVMDGMERTGLRQTG